MVRFTLPRDLYHGKGALEALKTLKGTRAMVCVGGGSMKRFGFLDKVVSYLEEAGMAFSNALLGIVHSMAHKTGAVFEDLGAHIIHGAANAMYLPKVIAFNAKDETAKKRYSVIADFMGLGGANDDEKVANLIAYLRGMNDALSIPQCIKNYGLDSLPCENGFIPENIFLERLPEIAKNAVADACTDSNPRKISV